MKIEAKHKKKLLIINKSQFGYHTDYYFFNKYLKSDYSITNLCMDYMQPRIDLPGVNIVYINRGHLKLIRSFYFIWRIIKEIRLHHPDLIMIYYFNYCSILKLIFFRKLFLLDIRTSSINGNTLKRAVWNIKLQIDASFFRNRTVISESLAKKLGFKSGSFHLLPLGAEEISSVKKSYDKFDLLYVGTFINRNIEQTIKGLSHFYKEYGDRIEITYTIIGFGTDENVDLIQKAIKNSGVEGITFEGRVPYNRLKDYFDKSNIGVTYIPVTEYFDCQPSTKIFEYIMSGLFCIATNTTENQRIIKPENGILCQDTPVAFFQALRQLYENKENLQDNKIRNSLESYKWQNIININFKNYLNQLLYV